MYRETFAIVDLQAIQDNVAAVRSLVHPGTRLLVPVKANGYGHGAVEVARAAVAGGATDFGVASVEEALVLRRGGITQPILVLGVVSPEAAREAANHHIAVTVGEDSLNWPDTPFDVPLSVHVKIDSGMGRLGVRTAEAAKRVGAWVAGRSDIHWAGTFTHLACADSPDIHHSQAQLARFNDILRALEEAGYQPGLVHAANSAATLRTSDWHYDMVRAGIAAYGYAPSPDFPMPVVVRPALHLYSFVTRIEEIEAGDTVGYGATFTAKGRTLVATVPVGYADGYFRALSNRAQVAIQGHLAPVVGNVCMDQLMVDVSHVPGVQLGDSVTLYGQYAPVDWTAERLAGLAEDEQEHYLTESFRQSDKSALISLDTLATAAGTISYELMCALSPRVPRIYTAPPRSL